MAIAMGAVLAVLVGANQVDLILQRAIGRAMETGLVIREELSAALADTPADQISADVPGGVIDESGEFSLSIYDEFGNVIESDSDQSEASQDVVRQLHTAITRREFQGRLFNYQLDRRTRRLTIYIPISRPEGVLVAVAHMTLTELDANLRRLTTQTVLVLAVVFVFVMTLTMYTWRRIVRPITRMRQAVDMITSGSFEVSLDFGRRDEIGQLSRAIHMMGGSLRDMEESARAANPLTGLPGNVKIEHRVRDLIHGKSTFCVIYADLDNFKAYNDAYGVAEGDNVIRFAAEVIQEASDAHRSEVSFVGHQGGDDFVVLCSEEQWEPICQQVVREFDAGIRRFYSEVDLERGYLESVSRRGESQRFPIMTISLGVVSNIHRALSSYAEVAAISAEMKRFVKEQEGSSYAIEQRSG
jgi:diguanylate cyclase (GGDEF)-like protein